MLKLQKCHQFQQKKRVCSKKSRLSIVNCRLFTTFAAANVMCSVVYISILHKAQMAESVDALVSNTSGATRAGSTPALGTSQDSTTIAKPSQTKA